MYPPRSISRTLLNIYDNRPGVFCKKGVLRNFAKFTWKQLCQSLFSYKVAGLRRATLLRKRLALVFYCEFCETSKSSFSYGTRPVTTSDSIMDFEVILSVFSQIKSIVKAVYLEFADKFSQQISHNVSYQTKTWIVRTISRAENVSYWYSQAVLTDHISSNFLKAVSHKFYLIHSSTSVPYTTA